MYTARESWGQLEGVPGDNTKETSLMPVRYKRGANGIRSFWNVLSILPRQKSDLAQQDQILCPFLGVSTGKLEGQGEYSDPHLGHKHNTYQSQLSWGLEDCSLWAGRSASQTVLHSKLWPPCTCSGMSLMFNIKISSRWWWWGGITVFLRTQNWKHTLAGIHFWRLLSALSLWGGWLTLQFSFEAPIWLAISEVGGWFQSWRQAPVTKDQEC